MNIITSILASLFIAFLITASFIFSSIGRACHPMNYGQIIYIKMSYLKLKINEYEIDCGKLESIDYLIKSQLKCWKGPYTKPRDLYDRIGNKYHFTKSNESYIITATGKDGILNTFDDLKSNDSSTRQSEVIRYYFNHLKNKEYLKAFYFLIGALLCLALIKITKVYGIFK